MSNLTPISDPEENSAPIPEPFPYWVLVVVIPSNLVPVASNPDSVASYPTLIASYPTLIASYPSPVASNPVPLASNPAPTEIFHIYRLLFFK